MIKQLLRAAVARDEVDGFAREQGFARSFDPPWTDGLRTTNWRRGEDVVALITDGLSAAALLVAKGPGEADVARRFGERFGARGLAEELAEARAASGAAARARASLRLGLLLRDEPPHPEVAALLAERLRDPEEPVRWAAISAAIDLFWRELDEAVEGAARRYEDMQPALERWTAQRREMDEAHAKEEAARQKEARRAGLHALAAEGKGERLVEELTAVLADMRRDDAAIKTLRGLLAVPAGVEAELTVALGAALGRDAQPEAVEVLTRATALLPDLPHAWVSLARAQHRDADPGAASASYERALALLRAGAPLSPAAARAAGLHEVIDGSISARSVTTELLRHHLSGKRYDRVLATAEAAIAVDPDDVDAWEKRAVALTFMNRHEEAIAAYGEAIAAMDRVTPEGPPSARDPRGLMFFNRACERARLGQKDEALSDLRAATRYDAEWGEKARADDYFEALWSDRDFLRVALGREAEAPTEDEVRKLTQRCLGLFYRGEGDEALEAGEQAAGMAEILGDPALLSDALKTWGNALTYLKGPAQGVARLRRAVALAEQAYPDDPAKRGEARHLLGAAHHAGSEYDETERCYRAALAERIAGLGERHWLLAKSYGDIARLEADQGRKGDAAATIERGRAVLRDFIAGAPEGDDRFEALFDLATLSSNLGRVQLDLGAVAPALDALEEAALCLDEMARGGRQPNPSLTRNALRHAAEAAQRAASDEALAARAAALSERLFEILEPSPLVRAERLYWARLRAGARELAARGVSDAEIASAMRDAIRGAEVPEPVRSHPAFANLAFELATRLGRRGDLVLVAMALSTAMSGGSLDEALDNLEGIAVAELEMAEAGEDIEDEDADGEDPDGG